jgi:hypothetical protein
MFERNYTVSFLLGRGVEWTVDIDGDPSYYKRLPGELELQPRIRQAAARWGANLLKNINIRMSSNSPETWVLPAYSILLSHHERFSLLGRLLYQRGLRSANTSLQAPSYNAPASNPGVRSLASRFRVELPPCLAETILRQPDERYNLEHWQCNE